MSVEFQDFSIKVKAAINDATVAWLHEVGSEIASQAQRNCQWGDDDDVGKQLKGSYKNNVDESAGEAQVGSALEQAYWEEWGTGEFAAHGDGRKGWWVYVSGQASQGGGKSYASKEDAAQAAAFLRSKGLDAHYTNGRRPSYTLEHAFDAVKSKAKARLEQILKERTE